MSNRSELQEKYYAAEHAMPYQNLRRAGCSANRRLPLGIQPKMAIATPLLLCFIFAQTSGAGNSQPEHRFVLTKDDGNPVCGAFLKLLRDANFRPNSPMCEIPITRDIEGFAPLQQTLLTEPDAENLFPHVYGFVSSQVQLTKSTPQMPSSTIRDLYGTNIFAWKYPAVSLSNDGLNEDILIWRGYGADRSFVVVKCGEDAMVHTKAYVYQPTQLGFVLSPDGQSIDEAATRSIFGMGGSYNDHVKPNGLHDFLEVGSFVGIFQYASRYYIYAVYQPGGDYRGRRANNPVMLQTIGVLRRQNNKTVEDCEIRDREHHW